MTLISTIFTWLTSSWWQQLIGLGGLAAVIAGAAKVIGYAKQQLFNAQIISNVAQAGTDESNLTNDLQSSEAALDRDATGNLAELMPALVCPTNAQGGVEFLVTLTNVAQDFTAALYADGISIGSLAYSSENKAVVCAVKLYNKGLRSLSVTVEGQAFKASVYVV